MQADIAIIGGSGVYDTSMLDNVQEVEIDTPFGKPSDAITIGSFGETNVAFLPRHGKGHRISPGKLNSRANILALKKLGVKRIISASAVGSLKLEHKPLDIVIPDQIFDRESVFISVHLWLQTPRSQLAKVQLSIDRPVCHFSGADRSLLLFTRVGEVLLKSLGKEVLTRAITGSPKVIIRGLRRKSNCSQRA